MDISPVYALLLSGVPLTLLVDLWPWDGPDSFDILRREASAAARMAHAS